MRSIYLVLILFIALLACKSNEKSVNPTAKVLTAFSAKFPGVKSQSWEQEDSGKFEADFKMNSRDCSAIFSSEGEWLQTSKAVLRSELPATVNRTIEDGFGQYSSDILNQVESPSKESYFHIKLVNNMGSKWVDLSMLGVILKQVEILKK